MEDQKVMVQRVKKNNQVSMMGLSIGEQKNYLLPVLYLEPFYRTHLRGQTIEETMREIASVYQGHQVGFYLDEDKVSDYEYIKRICSTGSLTMRRIRNCSNIHHMNAF